jgi:hypothetical protein
MFACPDSKTPRTSSVARNKYGGRSFSTTKKRRLHQNAFSNFEFRYRRNPFQFMGPEEYGKFYMAHKQKRWQANAPQKGYGLAL